MEAVDWASRGSLIAHHLTVWGAQTEGCVNRTSASGRVVVYPSGLRGQDHIAAPVPEEDLVCDSRKNLNLRRILYATKNNMTHCFPEPVRSLPVLFPVMVPVKAHIQRPEALLGLPVLGVVGDHSQKGRQRRGS